MRLIKNQNGAGMMMAMMAMAALGGAAFMMGDMFTNAEAVIKKDGRIVGYQLLVDTVRKNLYAGSNCSDTFAKSSAFRSSQQRHLVEDSLGQFTKAPMDVLNLTNALDSEVGIPTFQRGIEVMGLPLKLDNVPITLESNWSAKTGTSIKSMRMVINRVTSLPDPYTGDRIIRYPIDHTNPASGQVNLKSADAYLIIEPDHKGINIWAPENKKYWIKLFVYYDAISKEIHSCYDPTSEAVFCTETMNGAYVNKPDLPANARCRPDMSCFTYQSGLIDTSVACPTDAYTDYQTNQVSSIFKTCSWCPSTPYNLSALQSLVGADDFVDLGDLEDALDCDAANPYAGMSPREAWENFSEYQALRDELTPEQNAEFAGCINYEVPCYDYPETCANNCGGAPTCTCSTGTPDNTSTCLNECTNDSSACGSCVDDPNTCQNECTGSTAGCPCTDDPNTCQNECTGSTTGCPCTDNINTCANECGGADTCSCPTGFRDRPRTCHDECNDDSSACDTCDQTCFISGTQITMSDGTLKTIEDVLVGEKVIDGSYKVQEVEKFWKLPYKGLVYGINGGKHFFTPNHPFMTLDGWKSLNPTASMKEAPGTSVTMLKVGDILVTKNGFEPIYSLDGKEMDDFVYNFSISGSHEYFADDYLVHNRNFKPIDCFSGNK